MERTARITRLFWPVALSVTLAAGLMSVPAVRASASTRHDSPAGGQVRLPQFVSARLRPKSGLSFLAGLTDANPMASTGDARARSGVITGRVSGQVKGACVTASGSDTAKTALVGADGRYLIDGLRPGQYTVRVTSCRATATGSLYTATTQGTQTGLTVRAGMITTARAASIWTATRPRAQARPLTAVAAAKDGSISGVVTGSGRPQRGVCAIAYQEPYGGGIQARTSRNGTYKISGLKPGKYQVVFAAGTSDCPNDGNWLGQWYPDVNSLFPTKKVATLRIKAGENLKGINARLKQGGEIAGTVRDEAGKAIAGICVSVVGSFKQGSTSATEGYYQAATGKGGRYAAHGLFAGRYQVVFDNGCGNKGDYAFQWWRNAVSERKAADLKVAGTKVFGAVNAAMLPGAVISGKVTGTSASGKPLPYVCASATSKADGNLYGFTLTGKNGQYSMPGLAAGTYTLRFDPSCGDAPADHYVGKQVTVTLTVGEDDSGFNVYLREAGGISGLVTDAAGHPVGGVCVIVDDPDGDAAMTKPDGEYELLGVHSGSYVVQFTGGCGSAGSLAPQFYPDEQSSPFATAIAFHTATVTPDINATMQPGGTIEGTLTDSSGHLASRACAAIFSPTEYFPDQFSGRAPRFFTTVEHGHYKFANLPSSSFDIAFGCDGYASEYYREQPSLVTATAVSTTAASTIHVNARLALAGAIRGTITNSAGKPLGGQCVDLTPVSQDEALGISGTAGTNKKGRYTAGGLLPGRYVVQLGDCGSGRYAPEWYKNQTTIGHATPVRVTAGQTTTGVSAALGQGGSISGTVAGPSGKPLANVCVYAYSRATQAFGSARTNRSGAYRITGLATGGYLLDFAPCGSGMPALADLSRAGLVHVSAPHTTTVPAFKMTIAGTISGQMLGGAGGKVPLGGMCVLAEPASTTGYPSLAWTNGKGEYLLRNLASGRYRVLFGSPACDDYPDQAPPFAPQWYRDQPREALSSAVRVSAGKQTKNIGAVMQPFGSLSGTVTTTANAQVRGECVTAVPFKDPVQPLAGLPVVPELAVTDGAGDYSINGLIPGRYQIEFSSGCGDSGFATQWWNQATSAKTAKVITVGYVPITAVNATLHH